MLRHVEGGEARRPRSGTVEVSGAVTGGTCPDLLWYGERRTEWSMSGRPAQLFGLSSEIWGLVHGFG